MRRILLAALFILAGYYAVFGGEYTVADVRRAHDRADEARTELAHLQAETEALEARVDALEHDPRTLEALARERFGLVRDGEVLYRFADTGTGAPDGVDTGPSGR
jgi:cell division protein FtsB